MIRSILINRKRLKAKKRFYAFVLWNSDSGNFGLLSPKFLLFEAEWNVQHKEYTNLFFAFNLFLLHTNETELSHRYMNFIRFSSVFRQLSKAPKHVSVYDQLEVSPSHEKGKPVYDNTPEYSVSDVFFPKLSPLLPVLLRYRFPLGVRHFLLKE